MLVSVVMPSLNQAEFIERSVRSVLGQSDPAVELIVVDGGSDDGTQSLLSRMAEEAPGRLRWVSEADGGPAHAINKALAMAKGGVIGWLNADDVYLPGAIARAVHALETNPEWWMVYGLAQHIDSGDQVLGEYPTRTPDTPLEAFADGCFICQPTVFFKTTMVAALGGLDESLKTAFDFEWWLRMFSRDPKRVGFVDAVQASSRLHAGCITFSNRKTVIREGMQLLAHYLGAAPLHWFKTYVNDVLANYPHGQVDDLKAHLQNFADDIDHYLSEKDQAELQRMLQTDARIKLALPDAYLEIYPDGWLPPHASLRVRNPNLRWRKLEIRGRHVSKAGSLRLQISSPDGKAKVHRVNRRGPFCVRVDLPATSADCTFAINTEGGFIPCDHDIHSADTRELACHIEAIELHERTKLFVR